MKYISSCALFTLILLTGCKNKPTEPSFKQYINVPGDYSSIQSAIDASVDGDTILVDPGTYYENINFNGKEITLTSKFILDENEEHISNTIIDGENKGSVVTFENGETNNSKLIGFTIQGGNASFGNIIGGGIFCSFSSPVLNNLVIIDNHGSYGGGIGLTNSQPIIENCLLSKNKGGMKGGGFYSGDNSIVILSNTRISNNYLGVDDPNSDVLDGFDGSGIYCEYSEIELTNVSINNNHINHKTGRGAGIYLRESNLIFDKNNRCNIYNNTIENKAANNGSDLHYQSWNTTPPISEVFLDTFTVMNPTDYYAHPIEIFTFDIQNSILNQPPILGDYYVSPIGNNTNTGATPEEPFKNISYVLNNVPISESDSVTIHLANGTYSSSLTEEILPILLKNNISIIGESNEGVVIDGENLTRVVYGLDITNCSLSNLTITNGGNYYTGGGGGIMIGNSSLNLTNVTVNNCISESGHGPTGGGIYMYNSVCEFDTVNITNSSSGGLRLYDSQLDMTNSSISNNYSDEEGCGIIITYGSSVNLSNVIIRGNNAYYHSGIKSIESSVSLSNVIISGNSGSSVGFMNSTAVLTNCTIANNTFNNNYNPDNGGDINIINSNVTFLNLIIWNENIQNLSLLDWGIEGSDVTVNYTNLKNGESGIYNDGNGTLNWLDGNIDTDPLFIDPINADFHLQSGSPCINTGNSDAQYNDTDGSRNDMGAYGGPGGDW